MSTPRRTGLSYVFPEARIHETLHKTLPMCHVLGMLNERGGRSDLLERMQA